MIKEVGFGRTFNLGNYESERLDVRVEVESGETPEQAMERARQWVEQQHKRGEQVREFGEYVEDLKHRAESGEKRLGYINEHIERALKVYQEICEAAKAEGRELRDISNFGWGPVWVPKEPATDLIRPQEDEESSTQTDKEEDTPF